MKRSADRAEQAKQSLFDQYSKLKDQGSATWRERRRKGSVSESNPNYHSSTDEETVEDKSKSLPR
jgi:hypothetical protein